MKVLTEAGLKIQLHPNGTAHAMGCPRIYTTVTINTRTDKEQTLADKVASEVLEFWFGQSRPGQWFAKDPAFDALLRERFLGLTRRALSGELDAWGAEPTGGLALVLLLLDQFPRQIWRDTAMAFAGDPQALAESLRASSPLFERFSDPRTAAFARRYRDVIARFGRFPHRNSALGRVSSAEELAFLQTPGSRF